MCGFYFTNSIDKIVDDCFNDVKQRGTFFRIFNYKNFFGIETILSACNGKIFNAENDVYKLFFVGEIYNYDKTYINDTEFVFSELTKDPHNCSKFNGMYAFLLFNKKTNDIVIGRDKTGQIPLFFYDKDQTIVSTTIKSIVLNVSTVLLPETLKSWKQHKHYIYKQTVWENIYEFPPGYIKINGKYEKISDELFYGDENVEEIFEKIKFDYETILPSCSIVSGGIDSSLVSKFMDCGSITLNHVGKDFISNKIETAIPITEHQWCVYVDKFIESTYTIPYSWSWVGYYIIGDLLNEKINVLYTGEGADEIFGGYPGYELAEPTPYSGFSEYGNPLKNKIRDQEIFIPVASQGANLSLGCFTIEPRSPFLDLNFLNNLKFRDSIGKPELKTLYKKFFGDNPTKQGFAGFPNEYYNYVFDHDQTEFENDNYWKEACFYRLTEIAK